MADSSMNLNSITMRNRQKSYIGNGLIENHINQYYNEPKSFEEFVEVESERHKQKEWKWQFKSHRKAMPHCMGTMFWQLNDCWSGPSWSVIDYYGNEKAAYDMVKENYQPFLAKIDSNEVVFISDYPISTQWTTSISIRHKNKIEVVNMDVELSPLEVKRIKIPFTNKSKKLIKKGGIIDDDVRYHRTIWF